VVEMDPVELAARSPDVYVFYKDTTDLVGPFDKDKNPEYRFLANMERCPDSSWLWSGLAIIEAQNLYELHGFADAAVIEQSDHVDETAKAVTYGVKVLRSPPHFPNFGFARLRVEPGSGPSVLREIDNAVGYSGSAMVSGKFEILVEIGSDAPEEVCELLMVLANVPGVTGVEAGQVTGEWYYYRPRKRRVGRPEDEET
jgi:hypothetical protein